MGQKAPGPGWVLSLQAVPCSSPCPERPFPLRAAGTGTGHGSSFPSCSLSPWGRILLLWPCQNLPSSIPASPAPFPACPHGAGARGSPGTAGTGGFLPCYLLVCLFNCWSGLLLPGNPDSLKETRGFYYDCRVSSSVSTERIICHV